MERAIRTRSIIGARPVDVDPSWYIFYAPRPIYGDKEWRDGGGRGFFYAAVNPNGERADWMIRENGRLDAEYLDYIEEEAAFNANRARLIASRGEEIAEILDAPDSRSWVVSSYIDALNAQHAKEAADFDAANLDPVAYVERLRSEAGR